jgi:hypothetical protein
MRVHDPEFVPRGCLTTGEADGLLEGCKGDQECTDCILVENANVGPSDLPHQAVSEHGTVGIRWEEHQSNGLEEASEGVGDHMPSGQSSPQFHVRRGVFGIGWHGWSTHNSDSWAGHRVLCREGDACKALELHLSQIRDINPVFSDDIDLIVMVGVGIGHRHDRGLWLGACC